VERFHRNAMNGTIKKLIVFLFAKYKIKNRTGKRKKKRKAKMKLLISISLAGRSEKSVPRVLFAMITQAM